MEIVVNITLEQSTPFATLTINRPEQLNALDEATIKEVDEALERLDVSVLQALRITGAGDKAFVAGADIRAMAKKTPTEALEFARYGQEVFLKLESLPIMTVDCVNGFAHGGGLE
jgi:enoyl-CoA hydratase